jgi:transposase
MERRERGQTDDRYRMDSVLEDRPALGGRREQAGCFVLLTNLHPDGERAYSAEQVLRSYKQQYGIEQNFGFLKDEASSIQSSSRPRPGSKPLV